MRMGGSTPEWTGKKREWTGQPPEWTEKKCEWTGQPPEWAEKITHIVHHFNCNATLASPLPLVNEVYLHWAGAKLAVSARLRYLMENY